MNIHRLDLTEKQLKWKKMLLTRPAGLVLEEGIDEDWETFY
jgi:hypothetical protein